MPRHSNRPARVHVAQRDLRFNIVRSMNVLVVPASVPDPPTDGHMTSGTFKLNSLFAFPTIHFIL